MELGRSGTEHSENDNQGSLENRPPSFQGFDSSQNTDAEAELYEEVVKLAHFLNEMISKIRTAGTVMESVSNEMNLGTDELTEVGRKTEEATEKILDDSEKVVENHTFMSDRINKIRTRILNEDSVVGEALAQDFEDLEHLLTENKSAMMDLVGTLSFQDPAGQQLRKVASMLKVFQSRILKMVVTFGQRDLESSSNEHNKKDLLDELEYSSDGKVLDQDLVDRVLKDYGF